MCEGIELALFLQSLEGAELICDTKELRIPNESVMGLAALKCKQRDNGSYSRILHYVGEAKLELMPEQVFADLLREYFPHCEVTHHTQAGPCDVSVTWPGEAKFTIHFDIKTVDRDASTVTRQKSEEIAMEQDPEFKESLIYVLITYVAPTVIQVRKAFFPGFETWTPSLKEGSTTSFLNIADIA